MTTRDDSTGTFPLEGTDLLPVDEYFSRLERAPVPDDLTRGNSPYEAAESRSRQITTAIRARAASSARAEQARRNHQAYMDAAKWAAPAFYKQAQMTQIGQYAAMNALMVTAARADNDPLGSWLSHRMGPERYAEIVQYVDDEKRLAHYRSDEFHRSMQNASQTVESDSSAAYRAALESTARGMEAQFYDERNQRIDAWYERQSGVRRVTADEIMANAPAGEPPVDGGVGSFAWRQHARELQTALVGEEFGFETYRDSNGRVVMFDNVVGRFLDPDDLDRRLIGGFDPLYMVNQRNRLGGGNITEPVSLSQQLRRDAVQLGISLPDIPDTYLARHAESQPSRDRTWSGANYYEGDQWSTFAGMSANDKMQVQQRLIASGYLNPDSVVPGVWDYASAQAAQYLMTDANGNGVTWPEMLAEREANMPSQQGRGGGGGGGIRINPFVAPTYIAPDYDTLKQGVRQAFDSILGRNVMDHELKLLADSMGADYRLAYEAEVAAARSEYDRQVAAIRSGARYAGEGEAVQGVNPMDSLMENMLERYAPEVERTEQIHERAYNANLVMQAMGVLDRSVG